MSKKRFSAEQIDVAGVVVVEIAVGVVASLRLSKHCVTARNTRTGAERSSKETTTPVSIAKLTVLSSTPTTSSHLPSILTFVSTSTTAARSAFLVIARLVFGTITLLDATIRPWSPTASLGDWSSAALLPSKSP